MKTWTMVLDEIEDRINLAEESLSNGTDLDSRLLAEFSAPEDLGPLPAGLRPRANDLLSRHIQVEAQLIAAKSQISGALVRTGQSGTSRRAAAFTQNAAAAYIDQSI